MKGSLEDLEDQSADSSTLSITSELSVPKEESKEVKEVYAFVGVAKYQGVEAAVKQIPARSPIQIERRSDLMALKYVIRI